MIKIYDTLQGKKTELVPIEDGIVKMYVCGPTVYNLIHFGNARPAITFDSFRRYLEYRGYNVILVQNFTDVDDKIINKSNEFKVSPEEISERYINEYWKDSASIGIRPANFYPKTTDYLKKIINFIENLMEKGHAYESEGDVYFKVSSFDNYGELSHRKTEDMIAGARISPGEKKKSPEDFALWKLAKKGEPFWESPWGKGRPGWHIECSVMSTEILGDSFDIHAGGSDLIFPHHENEKAQSECKTGSIFSKYWMHNGMLQFSGEKMSKSVGNFITIKEAVQKYGKDASRLFLFSKHYRSPIDYSEKILADTKKGVDRARKILDNFKNTLAGEREFPLRDEWANKIIEEFKSVLDDDFNTPKAISIIFKLIREIENNDIKKSALAYDLIVNEFGPILGIFDSNTIEKDFKPDSIIQALLDIRKEYKDQKKYKEADKIRDLLNSSGIQIMDSPEGTTFSY